jgi:ketol-acid reductoisomerase
MDLALAYADAIGGTRAGVIETNFPRRPRPTCSASRPCCAAALTELVQAGFETLVEAGYQPEMAYFECLHELKLIVDLMYEGGIANMRYSISNTAEYGDREGVLDDITSGRFAEQFVNEVKSGGANFDALRKQGAEHQIETVGKELRSMMPWISAGKKSVTEISGGD